MKSIALDTLAGFFAGLSLFAYAIYSSTTNYLMFFHMPSFLMVIGGTLAASMISFKASYVIIALKELIRILIPHNVTNETIYKEIESIFKWARILKQKGSKELEKELSQAKIKDHFLKYGSELIITGYRGEQLRKMLVNFTETTFERNMISTYILKTMAGLAPAFGMLGTVIGLIVMLEKMGSDPLQLGKGLAFALITTLYGIFIAQLFFKPAAEKVKQRQEILRFRNLLVTEGLVLLGDNKDELLIQDMVNSFLDPNSHLSIQ
ncbi:MotA/TolQ/ExbB proton channel [Candidatus Magnetoovum chiemensis]|nr:MotA/TolQ/ExbB proton channel [Candidatus Magnetoovum chiemensis]